VGDHQLDDEVLASSHPVTILFDSGVSHLFISSSFMIKHSMSIATMKHTMLVSSPGGEMRIKHICPAVSISIRGRLSVEPHPLRLQMYWYHSGYGLVKQVRQNHSVRQKVSEADYIYI
jgi:hypothetical protein